MAQDRKNDRKAGPRRPHKPGGDRRPGGKTAGKPESKAGAVSGQPADSSPPERIARRLARAGIASRREAETMIEAGRVTVNGKVLQSPAFNVSARDVILVDGAPLPARERTRLFLFHKPAGTITTNRDPEGRRTIFDVLPKDLPRVMTIGRLDFSTEGLLLLTNDGGLARVLELPSTGWLRRYRVRVHGEVDPAALESLKEGISVDGVLYGAIDATLDRKQGSNAWLTLALREGKNREVRNVLGALGLEVTRLIRVSYGPFQLGDLAEGALVEVRGRLLRDQLGPRMIEQAGADFEAEIRQPLADVKPPRDKGRATDKAPRGRKTPVGREQALERLDTKPPRPGGGRKSGSAPGKSGDARPVSGKGGGQKPDDTARPRTANVWHASGARPLGPAGLKRRQEAADRPEGEAPRRKRGGKDGKHADRRR